MLPSPEEPGEAGMGQRMPNWEEVVCPQSRGGDAMGTKVGGEGDPPVGFSHPCPHPAFTAALRMRTGILHPPSTKQLQIDGLFI